MDTDTTTKTRMPQIEHDRLGIHDKQDGTRGGPPGWIALTIVAGFFLIAAIALLIASLLT